MVFVLQIVRGNTGTVNLITKACTYCTLLCVQYTHYSKYTEQTVLYIFGSTIVLLDQKEGMRGTVERERRGWTRGGGGGKGEGYCVRGRNIYMIPPPPPPPLWLGMSLSDT